jgi:hypothetical protein
MNETEPQPGQPRPAPEAERAAGSVCSAVLTFCAGLAGVWVFFYFRQPAVLGALTLLVCACILGAALYLLLRREEGDFRALALVGLGLFALQELFSYLALVHGLLRFHEPGVLFAFASAVYSALALFASLYEKSPRASPLLFSALRFAAGGVFLLSVLRSASVLAASYARLLDSAAIPVVCATAGALLFSLRRMRGRRAASSPPPASPAMPKPEGAMPPPAVSSPPDSASSSTAR